ncbi:MAG: hydroxymethylbilane synthase [Phycisphaeraceae bacterium]|nr:hydroxymethylbilane synthase [Phycisphaeraceae bacterium]
MRRSRKPIVIASRRSALARAQSEQVGNALARLHPNLDVEYRWIDTQGDQDPSASLADRGGKGLFTRALEQVLLAGDADIAIHSLKDLPADVMTAGLTIAAVPRRADVRDCLISHHAATRIEDLPQGATVGTSSPRRAAQLLRLRRDLRIEPMRGNVDTRVDKVLQQRVADATLLAVAGLTRLGKAEQAQHAIDLEQVLPAAAQGALALQCRSDDHVTLTRCLPINDAASATAVHAERQVVQMLGADCHSSIAVLAEPVAIDPKSVKRNADAHWFRLRVRVMSPDGSQCLEADDQVKTKDLRRLVKQMVADLRQRGAVGLLAPARTAPTQPAAKSA